MDQNKNIDRSVEKWQTWVAKQRKDVHNCWNTPANDGQELFANMSFVDLDDQLEQVVREHNQPPLVGDKQKAEVPRSQLTIPAWHNIAVGHVDGMIKTMKE